MSVGKSPKTKNKSSSTPLTPDQVSGYFNALDTLTGGSHTAPTTTQVWVPDASGRSGPDASNPMSFLYGGKDGENWIDLAGAGGHYETRTTPGSDSAGRLSTFAMSGTPEVNYAGAGSAGRAQAAQIGDQTANIRALGGLGATQTAEVNRARQQAIEQIGADAALDATQKARSRQLSDNDYATRLAAIAKESEAAIGQAGLSTAATNTGFQQQANLANQSAALEEARRRYAADVRNADLTKEDLMALAQIFFGGKGTTSTGSSSGGGWSFGLSL